jgi:hypothetical protein
MAATCRWSDIDAATAQQVESKRAEKLKSQSPSPGNEAALRRLVDGLISGKPDYDEMSPELAKATHDQLPSLRSDMAQLGSVQSIGFVAVGNGGEDIYIVKHEHFERYWRILLDSKGTISGARVTEGL